MQGNLIKIKLHKRVNIALDSLSPEERSSVLKEINYLASFGIGQALGSNLKKLKTDKPVYILRVDPSIRLILSATNQDEIEILDIVRRERLKVFATSDS